MKKVVYLFLLFTPIFAQSQQSDFLHLNKIIARLEANQIALGTWCSALHPSNAVGMIDCNGYPTFEESQNKAMLDFILIDMEHQPFDISMLRNYLLALNSKREVAAKGNLQPNIATLVRIPADGNQPVHAMIKQVLDIGVHGVVVPHVQNAQEAKKVISACRYVQTKSSKYSYPQGTRGASPWLASYLWGLSLPDYVARADVWPLNPDGDIMAILMIEDIAGVENIKEILKVPGIGAIIFGPYDFSFYAGCPGETTNKTVVQSWQIIKKACDEANVPLIGFANENNIDEKLKENYKMILAGHDVRNNGTFPQVLKAVQKTY